MTRRNTMTSQKDKGSTSSPEKGELVFLLVGKLRRSHGVRGEISMEILTDFPDRLRKGTMIYVGDDHRPLKIASVRGHGKLLLLSFDEYQDCESVGELRNCLVSVQKNTIQPLPEGEYYYHELLGLQVITMEGKVLGVLDEILETGANDVFVVKSEGGNEVLLPVIDGVVNDFDLKRGVITVSPPEWS